MVLDPVLPPAPRLLDDRWRSVISSQRRTLIVTGIAMGVLLSLCIWAAGLRPNRHMSFRDRVAFVSVGFAAYFGVIGLVSLQHRRRLWLVRNGEERRGLVVGDRRAFFLREFHVLVPDGVQNVVVPAIVPASLTLIEEVDGDGRRALRILVDPRHPQRWYPIPKARVL